MTKKQKKIKTEAGEQEQNRLKSDGDQLRSPIL